MFADQVSENCISPPFIGEINLGRQQLPEVWEELHTHWSNSSMRDQVYVLLLLLKQG
jgi:hypothetical protein